jgi:hypothetical protein
VCSKHRQTIIDPRQSGIYRPVLLLGRLEGLKAPNARTMPGTLEGRQSLAPQVEGGVLNRLLVGARDGAVELDLMLTFVRAALAALRRAGLTRDERLVGFAPD